MQNASNSDSLTDLKNKLSFPFDLAISLSRQKSSSGLTLNPSSFFIVSSLAFLPIVPRSSLANMPTICASYSSNEPRGLLASFLTIWTPYRVANGFDISPSFKSNATFSNSSTISLQPNQGSLPPFFADAWSSDSFLAASSKFAPPTTAS